ncbi:MAG TPA: patatin-like phospholipase family protein [Acidimicrobiales bacterium]|nr:patatin-like phospholipase family protein [Acidimicrobiales bacterium]
MTSIGLVLGAGGIVGQAYHAGVLHALETELGWDARTARVIVGSSAGAVTGTSLRMGIAGSDLAAVAAGTPLSPEGARLMEQLLPDTSDLPPLPAGSWLRPWRPPSAALLGRIIRRPLAFRPGVAAMTMLPAGRVDLRQRGEPLHRMVGDNWPEGLWICAVRRTDGHRVVFGRPGSPPAPLASAVLASCAIPSYFAPIEIGGVEYFDGGVHSPTNADALRSQPLDTVIVVSPMSSTHPPGDAPDGLLRWSAHRRLNRETRVLQHHGMSVIRFEPGAGSLEMMGLRPMANDRSHRVMEAAYRETSRRIRLGSVAKRLGLDRPRANNPNGEAAASV